jgi:hypothetical protein
MDGTNADGCTQERTPIRKRVTGFLDPVQPVAYVIFIAAVAVLAAVLGFWQAHHRGNQGVWWEVGRTGLSLFAVAVVGGVTAAAFRQRERNRERESRKDDYRAEFISDLWDAYHKTKAVRRELRGAGLEQRLARERPDFDEQQRETLADQMSNLNDAQLTIEGLVRTVRRERCEVFTRSKPDRDYGPRLLSLLTVAEDYAANVVSDWEEQFAPHKEHRGCVVGFLGSASGPRGLNRMTVALERAADIVYSLRSENRSDHYELDDPLIDCPLWDETIGIKKNDKSERITKPAGCP